MAHIGKKAPKKAKEFTKGHLVTKLEKPGRKPVGKVGKRTALVKSVIREISGLAPYEKKIMELVQTGGAKDDKKALKLAKRRLGTHRRGLRKREFIQGLVSQQRHK
jgi:large subunit ribosomal protein L36e